MKSRGASRPSTIRGILYAPEGPLRIARTLGPAGLGQVAAVRAAAASLLLAAAALLALGQPLPAAAAAAAGVGLWLGAPRLYRSLVGSGVDGEIPALLAYLAPYAHSTPTQGLAEVLAGLAGWRGPPFRWTRVEAARLKALLDSGRDTLTALQELARTTPSRALRKILGDYVNALRAGVPRRLVAQRLLDEALAGLRRSWQGYTAAARVLTELSAALAVLVAALAPAMALASIDPALAAPAALAPVAAAAWLSSSKPPLGLPRTNRAAQAAPLLAAAAVAAALLAGLEPRTALLALAPPAAAVEAYAAAKSRAWARARASLARALDKASIGLLDPGELLDSSEALPGVAEALARASTRAGTQGLSRALSTLARIVDEAYTLYRGAVSQALVLAATAIAAGAAGLYSIDAVASMLEHAPSQLAANAAALDAIRRVVAALSVTAPLPAAALARPYAPSLAPSLAAAAAVALIQS